MYVNVKRSSTSRGHCGSATKQRSCVHRNLLTNTQTSGILLTKLLRLDLS